MGLYIEPGSGGAVDVDRVSPLVEPFRPLPVRFVILDDSGEPHP